MKKIRSNTRNLVITLVLCLAYPSIFSAQEPVNDVTTPLHLLQPEYPIPSVEQIVTTLDRVYNYLESESASRLVNSKSNEEITDFKKLDENTIFELGAFRLTSYEWGVTYAGMTQITEATGDQKYVDYTNKRLKLIAYIAPFYLKKYEKNPAYPSPIKQSLQPHALDDAGAICAAMIKAKRAGLDAHLQPLIDNFITYISEKQFRYKDGTLARNRPPPNTLWLDDLFMSLPALAQMGKLTGDVKYYDDAVKQVR